MPVNHQAKNVFILLFFLEYRNKGIKAKYAKKNALTGGKERVKNSADRKTDKKKFIPLENTLWLTTGLFQILRTRGLIPRVSFLTGFIVSLSTDK